MRTSEKYKYRYKFEVCYSSGFQELSPTVSAVRNPTSGQWEVEFRYIHELIALAYLNNAFLHVAVPTMAESADGELPIITIEDSAPQTHDIPTLSADEIERRILRITVIHPYLQGEYASWAIEVIREYQQLLMDMGLRGYWIIFGSVTGEDIDWLAVGTPQGNKVILPDPIDLESGVPNSGKIYEIAKLLQGLKMEARR